MKFTTKIKSLDGLRAQIADGEHAYFGILTPQKHLDRLKAMGFSIPLIVGECLLPAKHWGSACALNSEGRLVPKRGQPKEMIYHAVRRSWRTGEKRKSKLIDTLYWQTPHIHEMPAALALTVQQREDGTVACVLPAIAVTIKNEPLLKTAIHMLVELFGECFALDGKLQALFEGEVRHLDWEILPAGQFPWERIARNTGKQVEDLIPARREAILGRLKLIRSFEPDFYAQGVHGFRGYHIFGFKKHDQYFLESAYWGNATYILGKQWESLSRKTKRELITSGTYEHRISHGRNWVGEITPLLNKIGTRPDSKGSS